MIKIPKRIKTGILIGSLITLLLAAAAFIKLPLFEALEEKLYDYRFKIRGQVKPPDNIVIAAIDEKSIEKLGRWPWSRDKIAKLVKNLSDAGAEIIVFDIIFSEHEKNDAILGKTISRAGNVLLPVVFDFEKKLTAPENKSLINSAYRSVMNPEMFNRYNPITAMRTLTPVYQLSREASGLGHINMFPDNDGTLRWESLVIYYEGYLYPSITLQASAFYLGIPQEKIILKAAEGIQLGKRFIPTDKWGRTLINYYGEERTFKHISISDILDGRAKPELLKGKVVLIGATAVGIYDLRVTPFSPAMPGVEKHANVIAAVLENKFLKAASPVVNIIIIILTGFLFSLAVSRFKALGASAAAGLSLMLIFSAAYYAFAAKGLWINAAYPSINILLIFISITAYNYAREEKYAKKMRAMFSSYVTEKIVDELIRNPDMAKLGGERREITILFSDIRGFTSFSEKHSPEEVVAILNEYLGAMTEIVFFWEGTLDKFVGDAIVAFWGAPMPQENHAELAIKCALGMVKKIEELQQKWKSEGKPVLDAGIGINTGEVIVGNIGAEGKKMDYTVIGDHVNLGSRVESLTRKYNTHILITEFTLNKIKSRVEMDKIYRVSITGLEKVIVKGKEKPVEIFELKSIAEGASCITEVEKQNVVCLKEK
ncbi:MAG: adenylate/guanylate cyclase domain-containing protein [Nitrospirae bacterium CG_4_10_14_3_um_filter_44_29]|nr:adenylate/guanylate cyclase domain-containing protein [Nitrospirota bacterium]OIO30033.1 MAG: adenylate/guanylate cyclase domain-containing protein [Nitrospirae bacterium CG1_02_44_142]PIP70862.1 MAG: adenylate/guanylate cyclase domain-containing protein [Nitrospirae bacterium CG22_combo_CG10-13_8_21_14_all_44_11]PIV66493.1 MAG: adenylate/guanylate cyclase domain-containing protein [Nitrospirae bacterium CG01_land_8_20_14_3_00_44_22]PIW90412.1 MAG: adenylate/guanylate cyclase domain-containi